MKGKKFTYEEVISVLECCSTRGRSCVECPAFEGVDRSRCREALAEALALLKELRRDRA